MTDPSRTLSRRRFLAGAAGLGALVLLGVLPEAAEGAALSALTAGMLTTAMASVPRKGSVRLPGGGTAKVADIRAAAAAFAVADAASPDPTKNPVAAVGVLVALAAWSGKSGSLDLTGTLPKAPVRPLRFALSRLADGAPTDTIAGALPPGLVVRPGGSLVVIGSTSGTRVLVAVEDPARNVAGHPRLELALVRSADLAPLLAAVGASLNAAGTTVTLASSSRVSLRKLEAALASRLTRAAGVLFVDAVPIQPKNATTPLLTVEPIVPPPPATIPGVARVSQATDGRVLALDGGAKAVGRAVPLADGRWMWAGNDPTTRFLLDFTTREYAEAIGVRLGSVYGLWTLDDPHSSPGGYERFIAQVDLAEYDGGLYWWEVEPHRGDYRFETLDRELADAKAHGLRVRCHAAIYPTMTTGLPDWLTKGHFSAQQLRGILVDHVTTLMERTKGRADEWVVVNEPYLPGYGYPENDLFYNAIGPEYVDLAFETARTVDPHAFLILNHTDNEHERGNTAGMRALAQRLRAKGLVDAVGLEMHMTDMDWVPGGIPTAGDVTSSVRAYEMPCVVTEFDYDLSNYKGTEVERQARQAEVYARLVGALLDAGVTEINFWGFEPRDTIFWQSDPTGAEPTMFGRGGVPKPAYFAVRDLFKVRAGLA